MDSPSGTGTMLRDAFISAVASQIVAAPSTYKIATLDGANKLTSSQDPSQSVSYLGGHDMVANSPTLADGSGTAGDTYYVTNPGTRDYGSGNITAQEGDALVYSGSVWQLVEGIANILDGISTASTARTTLEVNSIDEDAQANGTKVTAPALHFDGSSSVVTVSDDDKFSFTDGTDDLPFSVSAWIKASSLTNSVVASKFGASNSTREWRFYFDSSDLLTLDVQDTSGNSERVYATAALTPYEGQWVHVAATCSSASAPSARADDMTLFVNGEVVAKTENSSGTYTGMSNTAEAVRIGSRNSADYFEGSIRDVKIFNRELTSTEVAELARGNDLGFADEWGGTLGANGTIDETVGKTSWTGSGSITYTNITETPNTTVGGRPNVLKLAATSTVTGGETRFFFTSGTLGKRIRVEFDCYTPSTNVQVDGITALHSGGSVVISETTTDQWTRVSVDMLVGQGGTSTTLQLKLTDGGVDNATAGDFIGIDNFSITEIGTLADFRSEDYNESASKLLDRSSNNFVGVGTSVTFTGNQRHISADTIDLKNLPTSSAGLSAGEVWSNSGVLTVV